MTSASPGPLRIRMLLRVGALVVLGTGFLTSCQRATPTSCVTPNTLLMRIECGTELAGQAGVVTSKVGVSRWEAGVPSSTMVLEDVFPLDCARASNNYEVRLGNMYGPGERYRVSVLPTVDGQVLSNLRFEGDIDLEPGCSTLNVPLKSGAGVPGAVNLGGICDSSVKNQKDCAGDASVECIDGIWVLKEPCAGRCESGLCVGDCKPDSKATCSEDNAPVMCTEEFVWMRREACVGKACVDGECVGSCEPGKKQCGLDGNVEVCTDQGNWVPDVSPASQCQEGCTNGICDGCDENEVACNGLSLLRCTAAGKFEPESTCQYVCTPGIGESSGCTGSCVGGSRSCSDEGVPLICTVTGSWAPNPEENEGNTCPNVCNAGRCTGNCKPGTAACNGDGALVACENDGQRGTPVKCPASQFCREQGVSASCTTCPPTPAGCTASGAKTCNGLGVFECTTDGRGCLVLSAAPVADCSSAMRPTGSTATCEGGKCGYLCATNDACPQPGAWSCSGKDYRVCSDAMCPAWSAANSCPSRQVCSESARKCECPTRPAQCPSAGSGYRCNGAASVECGQENGCVFEIASTACANGCNASNGRCYPQCNPNSSERVCSADRLAQEVCNSEGRWQRQACQTSEIGAVATCSGGSCVVGCESAAGYRACAVGCYKTCPSFRAIEFGRRDPFEVGISGDGEVVVGRLSSSDEPESVFRWTNSGGVQDLGTETLLWVPVDTDFDGSVVQAGSFVWRAGVGFNYDESIRYGTAVSDDGLRLVGHESADGYWTDSVTRWELTNFRPRNISGDGAYAIGSSGDTAIRMLLSVSGSTNPEFLWLNGSADFSSQFGNVIYGESDGPNGSQPVRWAVDQGVEILTDWERIYSVDANGEVIVGLAKNGVPSVGKYGQSPLALQSLLTAAGVGLDGYSITSVEGISADGSIVAGLATKQSKTAVFLSRLPRL